jgi:hypothetical protein
MRPNHFVMAGVELEINLFALSPDSIDFDICEVPNEGEFDRVCGFLTAIGQAVGKSVLIWPRRATPNDLS